MEPIVSRIWKFSLGVLTAICPWVVISSTRASGFFLALLIAGTAVPHWLPAAEATPGYVIAWGAYANTNVPTGLIRVVALAAGAHHNVALKSDGTVVAWGSNINGETN